MRYEGNTFSGEPSACPLSVRPLSVVRPLRVVPHDNDEQCDAALTPISRDAMEGVNEIWHKYSSCKWTLLKRI